jgi:hypothetical protein
VEVMRGVLPDDGGTFTIVANVETKKKRKRKKYHEKREKKK